jgi:type II secretory pathway predicted ATPase ExeA
MNYQNPFTPVFGNVPPFLAGRSKFINDVMSGIDNAPGDPYRVVLFTGPRGSGKTVLLARIAEEAMRRGWIVAQALASPRMLDEMREQIESRATELLPKESGAKLTGVSVQGIGFTREIQPKKKVTWRTEMSRILDVLDQTGTGLMFVVDEASAEYETMIELAATFQIFVTEKRNVALIMASLPGNADRLFQHKSVSFLRRAFRRELGAVSQPEVRAAIKKTVEMAGRNIEEKALKTAAEMTGGYPFLIQLIGYHAFNQSSRKTITIVDVKAGIADSQEDMEHMVLDATIEDLSNKDIDFLLSMLIDEGSSKTVDIAKRMHVSASYAGQYKRRLVKLGVIVDSGRGSVDFAMPMFRDLLKERYL